MNCAHYQLDFLSKVLADEVPQRLDVEVRGRRLEPLLLLATAVAVVGDAAVQDGEGEGRSAAVDPIFGPLAAAGLWGAALADAVHVQGVVVRYGVGFLQRKGVHLWLCTLG